jgi:hypothetical protein
MTEQVPSIYFLVPGPWRTHGAILEALAAGGVAARAMDDSPLEAGELRVDRIEERAGFGDAMVRGRAGPLPSGVVAAAAGCPHAALLEFGFRLQDDTQRRVALAGRALRAAGGVAVRAEASGGASTWEPWLAQLESGDPMELVHSSVVVVGERGGGVFTCGMHAFGLPEAEIHLADSERAMEWVDVLCAYQVAEQPVLATGHSFQPDAQSERRRLERWPDHRHHPDDGRHNPFGTWRLVPDDEGALRPIDPSPVIVPSLVAQLSAAERQRGRALTREEVEALTEGATAMAMDQRDAAALERSRGYADLEPRRAFAQWQLVREWY